MKKTYILLASLLFCQTIMAQFDPDAKVALDAMSARYQKIKAFKATFQQQLKNETAELDESINGTIHIMGKMYKIEVSGQEIYNNSKEIWAYNAEAKEVTASTYHPEEESISLSNIWDIYRDGFKYIMLADNDNGNKVIDLDPVDRASKTYYKIRMLISQKDELKSFTVYENTGNQYIYTVLSFEQMNDLSDNFFRFDPEKYPGVEVIDFRD